MLSIDVSYFKKFIDLIIAVTPKVENKLHRAPAGLLVRIDVSGKVSLACTNGHSLLHIEPIDYSTNTDYKNIDFLIPIKTITDMKNIVKMMNDHESIVFELYKDELEVKITLGSISITSKLLSGAFPNYTSQLHKIDNKPYLDDIIGISPKLLSSFISKLKTDVMVVYFTGIKNPIFIKSDDYPGMIYAIMPIYLEGN